MLHKLFSFVYKKQLAVIKKQLTIARLNYQQLGGKVKGNKQDGPALEVEEAKR